MACRHFKIGNSTGIICGPKPRVRKCHKCHKDSVVLCDYPVVRNGRQTSCDAPCCRAHAKVVGPDLDYCVAHALMTPAIQEPLFK